MVQEANMTSSTRKYQEVPWISWQEWRRIHHNLFSNEIFNQRHAVARIAAWRSRMPLPIAVDVTSQLIELHVHERLAMNHHHSVGTSSRSYMELCLLYASVIVRCVNGLVDSAQKTTYAIAVSALAKRIGIPLWIVDLRHESTHNQLPSLSVLRFAAQHLLAWLRANYWLPQENALIGSVDDIVKKFETSLLNQGNPTINFKWIADISCDELRTVIVPLLVDGITIGDHRKNGLLFVHPHESTKLLATTIDLQEYPKERMVNILLVIQRIWNNFSALLLAQLCCKTFAMEYSNDTHQVEQEIGLMWIKLLVHNEWRERLKFATEPIDEVYLAGAEILAMCVRLKRQQSVPPIVESIENALRSCKGIRNHPMTLASRTLDYQQNKMTSPILPCQKLEFWKACPLGSRCKYYEMDVNAFEYPLELDDFADPAPAFVVSSGEWNDEETEETNIESYMKELDQEYTIMQEEVLMLQREIYQTIVKEGKSSGRVILPQDEVQRIQNQIEIW